MALSLLLALLALAAAGEPPVGGPSSDAAPVAVFAELDGVWEGTFVGYDLAGEELYRIAVRQVYRTVDEETQTVEIEDRQPDGSVVRGRGVNRARRLADGSLALTCIVTKSNGDRAEHRGRLARGPDGGKQIFWFSQSEDRRELFRERVLHEGDEEVYRIDGVGLYGETTILMAGRYVRRAPADVGSE